MEQLHKEKELVESKIQNVRKPSAANLHLASPSPSGDAAHFDEVRGRALGAEAPLLEQTD